MAGVVLEPDHAADAVLVGDDDDPLPVPGQQRHLGADAEVLVLGADRLAAAAVGAHELVDLLVVHALAVVGDVAAEDAEVLDALPLDPEVDLGAPRPRRRSPSAPAATGPGVRMSRLLRSTIGPLAPIRSGRTSA